MEKKSSKSKTEKTASASRPRADADPSKTAELDSERLADSIAEPGDTVTTGVAADEPVTVVMKPPKKHRIGLIVAIIVIILMLVGGGALAFWYFGVYNNPENVTYDAIRQFLTAENVVTDGTIEIASKQTSNSTIVASFELDSSSMRVPNASSVKLSVSERDKNNNVVDDHLVEVGLGTAIMSDGEIYIRITDAATALKQISESSEDAFTTYGDLGDMIYEIVDIIDNEWWQISFDDLVKTLDIDKSDAEPALEFYDCVLNIAQSDYLAEIATLYTDHRFAQFAKLDRAASEPGRSVYGISSLDHGVLADFINALPETAAANEFYSCYNDYARAANDGGRIDEMSARDFDEVSAEDITDALPEEWEVSLEIADLGHRLHRLGANAKEDDNTLTVDLGFDYTPADVTTPENYRPITDLIDEIGEIVSEYFNMNGDELASGSSVGEN